MRWIDKQLEERGLPRRALADVIPGWTETKISLVMSGRRKLSADEADTIRRFFGYRLPEDPPRSDAERITSAIETLSDGQLRALSLYLDALNGSHS